MDGGGLLERERELELLGRAVEDAISGAGGVVVVAGPPGIGKSALLLAAVERARALGLRVLSARGGALERAYPFGVVAQLFDGRLRLRGGEGSGGSLRAEALADAGAQRFAVLEELWRRLRQRSPALVAVDDLHWADPESLRLLAFAAMRCERASVLLVVALRPGEPGSDGALLEGICSARGALLLEPEPLSAAGVAALLGAHGLTVDSELSEACRHSTGGNPYLAHELARSLASESRDAAEPKALARLAPAGVARTVLARLAGLSADAVAVCGALAVLGGRAEARLIAALAGLEHEAVARAADLLADAHVLAGGRPLEFVHPLVRQAIYHDMPLARREQAHRAAARLLAAEPTGDLDQMAAHLLVCDPAGEQWVVDALARAARQALERAAPESACSYLERALREPPLPGRLPELLLLLGEARLRAGSPKPAVEALEAALQASGEPVARALIASRLQVALTHLQRGDHGAALLVAAIADLPEAEREPGLELEAQLVLAGLLQAGAARAIAGRRPRFVAPRRAPRSRGELVSIAAEACRASVRGTASEAAALAELALSDGRLLAEEGPESPLLYLSCFALIHVDRLARAEEVLTDAIELARERHSPLGETIARAIRAVVRQRAGRLTLAVADAKAVLGALDLGLRFGPRPALHALVLALIDQGRPLEAARALEGLEFSETLAEAATAAVAHARGCLRAALGRHEQAIEDFDLCGRLETSFDVVPPVIAPWRSSKATSLAALGRGAQALSLAREEVDLARAYGSARCLGIALTVAGRISGDLAALHEAVAVLAPCEARLEHARAQLALGAALRRRGQRKAARQPLREALAQARRCGAVAVAEQVHRELQATGARPRKIVRAGADALTPAERRVAELAADGRTNRQIAAELTISVRTVESHLAHAYQKLDISARRQLAGALADEHRPAAT